MQIRFDDLHGPEIAELLAAHVEHCRTSSPPESTHALDVPALRSPGITFWSAWDGASLLGCAALKELDPSHGEVKSMHTAVQFRGRGVALRLLERVVDEARLRRYRRLSLETGSMAAFAPARALYARYGFVVCGPFADYRLDPNSVFMTLDLGRGQTPFGYGRRQNETLEERGLTPTHMGPFKDIGVDLDKTMVATIEIRRPPHNFFDIDLIRQIADACEALDKDAACRAIVLAAQGTAFCAGAKLGDGADVQDVLAKRSEAGQGGHLYIEAVRLFRTAKPMVGAIHGAAVGGGLGLALVPDLRVTCPEARFCANFARLGFHPGFGLTHTLPALIGPTKAAMMFYTSRRVPGEEAHRMGLADVLVPRDEVRAAARKLAAEIAECSPLGVLETRATMRAGLADRVRAATDIELEKQTRLRRTEDFKEGVSAVNERRVPNFVGR